MPVMSKGMRVEDSQLAKTMGAKGEFSLHPFYYSAGGGGDGTALLKLDLGVLREDGGGACGLDGRGDLEMWWGGGRPGGRGG